mgnify:FL=1
MLNWSRRFFGVLKRARRRPTSSRAQYRLCTYSASCLGEDLWGGRVAEGVSLEACLAAAWIAVLGGSCG